MRDHQMGLRAAEVMVVSLAAPFPHPISLGLDCGSGCAGRQMAEKTTPTTSGMSSRLFMIYMWYTASVVVAFPIAYSPSTQKAKGPRRIALAARGSLDEE